MSFALNLRNMMNIRNIEIKQLAKMTGISKNTIDNYLSGQKSLPNAENAVKIAQILNVSVEQLVTGKNTLEANIALFPFSIQRIVNDLLQLDESDIPAVTALVSELKKRNSSHSITREDFRRELFALFNQAEKDGKTDCIVTSGELHRLVGGYPGTNHRMPVCCSVMNEYYNPQTDSIVYSPPGWAGATLSIRYALPRTYP